MSVHCKCKCEKESFEAPESLFTDFKWPKCSCNKPFIILKETNGLSNTSASNRKSMVSPRDSSKFKKR